MLEWYVYMTPLSGRVDQKPRAFNVFTNGSFMADLKKAARKYRDREREQFEEQLRRELMYYFWCKCEWEIVLTRWPPFDTSDERFNRSSEKVDVYSQVMLNWDRFREYVWANRAELRRREKASEAGV